MLRHVHGVAAVDTVGVVGAGIGLRWSVAVQSVDLRRYRYLMLVVQVLLLLADADIVRLGIDRYRMVGILLDHWNLVVVMRQWKRRVGCYGR